MLLGSSCGAVKHSGVASPPLLATVGKRVKLHLLLSLHPPSHSPSLHPHVQADSVERFVVVHGQIILNQFKHFPNKAVQKAAFVGELRSKMETRKHSKLYMSKVWTWMCVDV